MIYKCLKWTKLKDTLSRKLESMKKRKENYINFVLTRRTRRASAGATGAPALRVPDFVF
jgi:hypothetical protein